MLRVRTGFSFNVAYGHIWDVASRLKEIDSEFAPITDRASTAGFVRHTKVNKDRKVVYGVEIATTSDTEPRNPVRCYNTFIAINDIRPINFLLKMATANFKQEPLLTYEQLAFDQFPVIKGDVFMIVGENFNLNDIDYLNKYLKKDNVVFALSPHTSQGLYNAAYNNDFKFVASSNNYFPRPHDFPQYELLIKKPLTSLKPLWLMDWSEYEEKTEFDCTKAISNTTKLLQCCKATLKRATIAVPPKPKTIKEMCLEGAKRIGIEMAGEYHERLEKELGVIHEKGFEDYFYIVAELCHWARARMLIGPGRGSACGSLVCFLLGITSVDPLEHGLIFERFIDINRSDLPDIDLDFPDIHRGEVIKHLEDLYGKPHVAKLGAFSFAKMRSIMREIVWKQLKVPSHVVGKFVADAEQASVQTIKANYDGSFLAEHYPHTDVVVGIEGHPSHITQHAAGVIVAKDDLLDIVAINDRDGAHSLYADLKDAEDLNLLKIDVLGLTQLSILQRACELAKIDFHDLYKLDKNDKWAFEILNSGRLCGIFQMSGETLRKLCKDVTFTSIDDIAILSALARPGPLGSGETQQWISRKVSGHVPSIIHHAFERALAPTMGILVYQEQVMFIAREVCKMDWPDVISLRKGIGKKLGDDFLNDFKSKFISGGISNGVPERIIKQVWDHILHHGSYSFNKSHAVAYAYISYWCCYIKAHYPLEFASACLSQETQDNMIWTLREFVDEGFGYIPFCPKRSTTEWQGIKVGDKPMLIGPLTLVHGIGKKKALKYIQEREQSNFKVPKEFNSVKTPIDVLYPIRDKIASMDLEKKNIKSETFTVKDMLEMKTTEDEIVGIVEIVGIRIKDANDPQKIEERGYKVDGNSKYLNIQGQDETGKMLFIVQRNKYQKIGLPLAQNFKKGMLVAFKGKMVTLGLLTFMSVEMARIVGNVYD